MAEDPKKKAGRAAAAARKQAEIFQEKIRQLEARQDKLLTFVKDRMQKALVKSIYENVVDRLEVQDGQIKDTAKNLRLIAAMERVFNQFDIIYGGQLVGNLTNDLSEIGSLNDSYYELYNLTSRAKFKDIRKAVNDRMRQSLGITDKGDIAQGGYLDLLVNDNTLRRDLKKMTFDAVRQQKPIKDFREGLGVKIEGSENVDGELVKYYRGFAYDKYQEYDRAYNTEFAKKLDLKAFRYQGGIIDDSRDFCRERNGKVFTIEEAQEWANDPDLPKTKAEKESGVLTDYNPLINCGRWNCRHTVRFISQDMAIRERPELEAYFNG